MLGIDVYLKETLSSRRLFAWDPFPLSVGKIARHALHMADVGASPFHSVMMSFGVSMGVPPARGPELCPQSNPVVCRVSDICLDCLTLVDLAQRTIFTHMPR
jgi:hypothetical protein